MSPEIISVVVLVAMFVVAGFFPVNLGAIGLVAATTVGILVGGLSEDDVMGEFPGDLFLIIVGLTYLFAIAYRNGTVDLLVRWSMRAVRGHLAAAPWIFFVLSAVFSAIGALFAVAIVAPIAMPFARRYGVDRLLMGAMVVHGSLGGAFSPISVYGTFVNTEVAKTPLPSSPTTLFLAPLVINIAIAGVVFLTLGGRRLAGEKVDVDRLGTDDATEPGPEPSGTSGTSGASVSSVSSGSSGTTTADRTAPGTTTDTATETTTDTATDTTTDTAPGLGREQTLTLVGIGVLAVGTVALRLDPGILSLAIAVLLGVLMPRGHAEAAKGISWSTVLLVCGVVTYVGVLQEMGTTDWAGGGIVALGVPLLVALLLCYLGGVLSAFASSVGILGVAIPLSLPFLLQGSVSAVGGIAALAVASTVVDVSPFSTNGALVLASTPDEDRDALYRRMLVYSAIIVATGPLLAWALLVLPGWL